MYITYAGYHSTIAVHTHPKAVSLFLARVATVRVIATTDLAPASPLSVRDTPETSQVCTIQRRHCALTKGLCTWKKGKVSDFLSLIVRVKLKVL